MLARPISINDQEQRFCRVLYKHFATEVMRFMEKRGTASSIFKFPPSSSYQHVERYCWPAFIFAKGHVYDTNGFKEVVAVPLDKTLEIALDSFIFCTSI
jgi:hypothetical protein